MVTRVAIQGKEWDLVEGYYLWYSQDGKQWKAYSESGDKLQANVRVCLSNFSFSCEIQITRVRVFVVWQLTNSFLVVRISPVTNLFLHLTEDSFLYDAQQSFST